SYSLFLAHTLPFATLLWQSSSVFNSFMGPLVLDAIRGLLSDKLLFFFWLLFVMSYILWFEHARGLYFVADLRSLNHFSPLFFFGVRNRFEHAEAFTAGALSAWQERFLTRYISVCS